MLWKLQSPKTYLTAKQKKNSDSADSVAEISSLCNPLRYMCYLLVQSRYEKSIFSMSKPAGSW